MCVWCVVPLRHFLVMNRVEFERCYDRLSRCQKNVLHLFLAYESDEAIAQELDCGQSNVRRHLSNICQIFGLTNDEGEHYSYRWDLVEIFLAYQPEKVDKRWPEKLGLLPEKPRFPGRPMVVGSKFYVDRPLVDTVCCDEIERAGALIRIRAPRKMGKTSLLNKIMKYAQDKGYHTVTLPFYSLGAEILEDLEKFLWWLCDSMGTELGLDPQVDAYTKAVHRVGAAGSCRRYIQNILREVKGPLVVGLDQVDVLFDYPAIAATFFGLLRGWSEEAKTHELWGQLRQVVIYSTDVYIDLDLHQSPFNVGLPISLEELASEQVQELARRYGLKSLVKGDLKTLMDLVGGHPHLLQLAFYHLYEGKVTLPEILESADSPTGIYANHLATLKDALESHPPLMESLQTILASAEPVEISAIAAKKLEGLGLVKRRHSRVEIRCKLYRRYFQTV